MNWLWLFLIIPGCVLLGFLVAGLIFSGKMEDQAVERITHQIEKRERIKARLGGG